MFSFYFLPNALYFLVFFFLLTKNCISLSQLDSRTCIYEFLKELTFGLVKCGPIVFEQESFSAEVLVSTAAAVHLPFV